MFITESEDYEASSFPVTFVSDSSSSRSLCFNVSIIFDDSVEDMEEFHTFINSSDTNVRITQSNSTVIIVDNSGKLSLVYTYTYEIFFEHHIYGGL